MSCFDDAMNLQKMMSEGKAMEAFDKYYADDVVVVEMPTGETRKGKEAQRKAINQWFSTVKERHGGGIGEMTSNEKAGVTCVEAWFDCTFADGNRMKMEEVAVQKWKNGQIVHEKFYYNMPGK